MKTEHLFFLHPADKDQPGIMSENDPFSETERSKSEEHNNRLSFDINFQKTQKTEEIES